MKKKLTAIIATLLLTFSFAAASTPATAFAATWYKPSQFGIGDGDTQNYDIELLSGNTIRYRSDRGSDTPILGKWHKAKLTKSTVYLRGSLNRYTNGHIDFLKKSNKNTFKKYVRTHKYTTYGISVKNGKVKSVAFDAVVAG